MRHLFLLFSLMVATMIAAIGSSCKDEPAIETEPEPELEIPGPNDTVSIAGLIPVTAFYDSIYECIALELETARVRDGWWDTAKVKKVRFIPIWGEPAFDVKPGQKLYIQIASFGLGCQYYIPEGQIGYFMVGLRTKVDARAIDNEYDSFTDILAETEMPFFDPYRSSSEYLYDKEIKIYVHVLQNIDGSGVHVIEEEAQKVLTSLQQYFNGTGLSFTCAGVEAHNYLTEKLDLSTVKSGDKIFSLNRHNDGIDIYIPASAVINILYSESGLSEGLNGGSIISIFSVGNTVAHEMGHSLGLFHTHKGTCTRHNSSWASSDGGTPEFADGSNGATAGDGIADTPADPKLWDDNGNYSGGTGVRDAHNQTYSPDPYNLMSYSSKKCRFSQGQIERMHYNLVYHKSEYLFTPVVTGPKHFAKSAKYSFNYGGSQNLEWVVKRHKASASMDDVPEIVQTEYYSASLNPLTLSSSESEYLEIGFKIAGSASDEPMGTISATTNAPSPISGYLRWSTSPGSANWNESSNMQWGESLYLSSNASTLYLDYRDKAGATLSNVNFMTVTAANRLLRGSTISVTKADCANGYLKFRISDACGTSAGYFTIPVNIAGSYYAVNVDSESLTFTTHRGASAEGTMRLPAKELRIGSLKIHTASGQLIYDSEQNSSASMVIDTSKWPKGDYVAILTDGGDYSQTIPFTI